MISHKGSQEPLKVGARESEKSGRQYIVVKQFTCVAPLQRSNVYILENTDSNLFKCSSTGSEFARGELVECGHARRAALFLLLALRVPGRYALC